MLKLFYSLLLIGTSGGVGLAAVVGWLNIKLYRRDRDRRRKSLGVLLVSILAQNGILTYRLIELGTTEVNVLSILYVASLAGSTVGLAWKAGQFTQDLALEEALGNGKDPRGLWVANTERRLTAEEARNTTIEHYAAAQAEKQEESEGRLDRAEQRADDTEDHA